MLPRENDRQKGKYVVSVLNQEEKKIKNLIKITLSKTSASSHTMYVFIFI